MVLSAYELASHKSNTPPSLSKDTLDEWIDKLQVYESQGHENDPHLRILDSNKKYSYGCLMFQEATWKANAKLIFKNAESEELMNLIYDCNLQKIVAKDMIRRNHSAYRNWYTSVVVRKLGVPPRLD